MIRFLADENFDRWIVRSPGFPLLTFQRFHAILIQRDPMAVTIELPSDVEQRLRAENPDLDAEAKAALLIELYRQEKLTHYELAQALGLDRFETDNLLKKHKVGIDLPTREELEQDLRHLRQLVGH
jgi:predicted HTH domain antitoxin